MGSASYITQNICTSAVYGVADSYFVLLVMLNGEKVFYKVKVYL